MEVTPGKQMVRYQPVEVSRLWVLRGAMSSSPPES